MMTKRSLLILTGHSQGLGRAILDWYLSQENFEIIGISRTSLNLKLPRLREISLDLSRVDLLEEQLDSIFPQGEYDQLILINNAGAIGEIKQVGNLTAPRFQELFNLNVLAPVALTNAFVQRYQRKTGLRIVCNISSGAAHKPLEGWAGYCSSKAALAMFTQVCQKENESSEIRFFSLAPGIVDTGMQSEIRDSQAADFPAIARFKEYKSEGKLSSGAEVAEKIAYLLANPSVFEGVSQDVRDFELP